MSMIDGVYFVIRSGVPITHFEKGGILETKTSAAVTTAKYNFTKKSVILDST